MKLSELTPIEVAQLSENLSTVLSGTELSAIETHVRANLVTAIGTKPAELVAKVAAAEALRAQANAADSDVADAVAELLTPCRQTRDSLKLAKAPKKQFDLAGFDFSDGTRTSYVAQAPTELSVVGFSNGVNEGKFKGNNKSSAILYEVWRREGDDGDWGMNQAVKTSKFTDEGVTPGQYYEYKVRAKASKSLSQWSNPAVVYGQMKPGP